ncbi:MAG: bifunctional glutamate N-acetyltransferase/amino-acid acetyltransferase ArgJ [Gammaproteobacteria bacterium]|nr:MAG: bifunctional glutamate N-acetyltransferase/amino-acid acetyltransferase ArgJ [Gammaproteobacteria bacterium]
MKKWCEIAGIRLAAGAAGIRKPGRDDLVLMELAEGSATAAVFTRNAFCAAPVRVAREHLATAEPRWLLINSGNANAGMGEQGLRDARACCEALARLAGDRESSVLPFSTGVIGERLPAGRITASLPTLLEQLAPDCWPEAARAIMTTDTRPKMACRTFRLGESECRLTGIAKGAGMICPDMATMLAFIATDARVPRPLLQALLEEAVEVSFNRITVDGDTSTNDACVLVASGRGGVEIGSGAGPAATAFREALGSLCRELAQAIVRDGEGATKFIELRIRGGRSEAECLAVGRTVANSPLVKTAFFASDPNWGRILAAVGRAGIADLEVGKVDIHLGEVRIVRQGGRDPGYREELGAAVMAGDEITVTIDLGRGDAATTVWTCDLSYDYVRINAEYRT